MNLANYFIFDDIFIIIGIASIISVLSVSIGRTFDLGPEYTNTFDLKTYLFSQFMLYSIILMECSIFYDYIVYHISNAILPYLMERIDNEKKKILDYNEHEFWKYFKCVFRPLYVDLLISYALFVCFWMSVVQEKLYHYAMNYIIVGK